jgi:hypothetical protein
MTFLTALESELNVTTTANGAKAYSSTLNCCLDLFGTIAASRDNIDNVRRIFARAYQTNPEVALLILFWARDIRGGQGERKVFRELFKYLATQDEAAVRKVINLVPYYGRWDDLLVLEETNLWPEVLKMIEKQLFFDLNSQDDHDSVSLLAKWLPSINASSQNSKRLGRKIAAHLGWSERIYRKKLQFLRTKIRIVEQKMCAKQWSEIEYSHLPSRAAFMYRKAFNKRDEMRYKQYLESVEKGEAKINAGTLYPYDIVDQYLNKGARDDKTIDLQWEALPNFMEGNEFNGLVVADVSGSMSGLPMAVSISLAMYISERNSSPVWKNKFITFSMKPSIQSVVGKTIGDKINNLRRAEWGYNTNLVAVFNTILSAAKEHKVAPSEMPQKLIIVSDMQFDEACASNSKTNFEHITSLYRDAGYELPQLIFWNVRGNSNVPIKADDTGTALVSGCSPSILKTILSGNQVTPVDTMMETLYVERYQPIVDALKSN